MNIYHYTSLEALIGICRSKNLCFWATRFDSLNDPTDYIYAKDIIEPALKQHIKDCAWSEEEGYPYIVSFSRVKDDFNMWRMYNAEIALEFEAKLIKSWVASNNSQNKKSDYLIFSKCYYPKSEGDIYKDFIKIHNSLDASNDIHMDVQEALAFIKRPEFHLENEMRLCAFDYDGIISNYTPDGGIFLNTEIGKGIKVKCAKNGDLILYKEFLLPLKCLKGIIINTDSSEKFEKIKSHISLFLLEQGYNLRDINISQTKTGYKIR